MFSEQYIVSVICKNTLIQHLVRGSLREAKRLAGGFYVGTFKGRRSQGSIVEILNNEINFYISDNSKYFVTKRNLDDDIFITQEFKVDKDGYSVDYGYTPDFCDVIEFFKFPNPNNNNRIANKVSFREITRIDSDGTEYPVELMEHTYYKDTGTVEIHSAPIKIKLK